MQKVFDLIKERLEKGVEHCLAMHDWQGQSAYESAIEIINRVAEECKDGHFGCNSNGEHEKCEGCGYAEKCPNYKREWFEKLKNDVSEISASHAAWETIYRRILEVIDEYAAVADIVNVKDCKVLSDLLRHYKEQLTEEFKPKLFQISQELNKDNKSSCWIPVDEKYPDTEEYILLSFQNYPHPLVGNYRTDEDGGAFYLVGDEETCVQQYMFVNAWMPIKPYREKE